MLPQNQAEQQRENSEYGLLGLADPRSGLEQG
jgi:hypothetical protein